MCLLLKEKSPSNKDEIGFFPCIAVHAAPLLSWTVSGHSQERGDGSSRFVCSGKAASQGMLDVQGQAQRLKVKLRLSVHLVSPLAPATMVPYGLQELLGTLQGSSDPAAHSLQQGCPTCHGLPTWHRLCQAIQQPVELEGVSAARCRGPSHPALPWEGASMVGA